jgi:hypothetical protein
LDNIAGTPVENENFFGRETEVACLVEILATDDILLLGPRRIGKTSIARAVMAKVRTNGWRSIEINVASCVDERGFLDKLGAAVTPELASIASKATSSVVNTFATIIGRIKSVKIPIPGAGSFGMELGDGTSEEWTKVANEALQLIERAEDRWLIYVDELPIMLYHIIRTDPQTGVQRVRRFLDWFRNDVRALPTASNVRWLITGSVGLDTLVQQFGMADTINSLNHQSLAPFSEEVAVNMLLTLANRYSIPLTPNDAANIVAAVQWCQPYYLQNVFNHLRSLILMSTNASPSSLIEQAVNKLMQHGTDNDFHYWEERLFIQLRQTDANHAIIMLNLAAADPKGARPESMLTALGERMANSSQDEVRRTFMNLRDILVRDAYLWADTSSGMKRYRFHLEPLRSWWLQRDTL